MTELSQPLNIIKPFSLEEIGGEFFLIHNFNADIYHLNALSKLYVECLQLEIPKQQIINAVAARFDMATADVEGDFDVFLGSLSAAKAAKPSLNTSLRLLEPDNFVACSSLPTRPAITCEAGGIVFSISSEDTYASRMIEARLPLMRTASKPSGKVCNIAIIKGSNGFAITVNGEVQVAAKDNHWLDVLVMQAMLDQISIDSLNTAILHAAAVANDKGEAFIFAAPSGGGKSTLATFLALNGYEYLGDDIVLLDCAKKEVTPFRSAPNLKPGSWPLFNKALPTLNDQEIFRPNIKPVKFASLKIKSPLQHTYRVKALFFPEFDSNASASTSTLTLAESFAYLAEIRHNTGQKNLFTTARQLIEFTHSTPCITLSYSTLDELYMQMNKLQLD